MYTVKVFLAKTSLFCDYRNFVYCHPAVVIFRKSTLCKIETGGCVISVTALPCKILITTLFASSLLLLAHNNVELAISGYFLNINQPFWTLTNLHWTKLWSLLL